MLRWSQAVLLAFHAMALLASKKGVTMTVGEMAESLDVSSDHLSKVMQKLGKANLVKSARGPNGGYLLIVDPDTTSLLVIYECMEGEYSNRNCMLKDKACVREKCMFGEMVGNINGMVSDYLSKTMLSAVSEKA